MPRDALRPNAHTGPSPSLEASDLINIAVESSSESGTALVCRSIKIEAVDDRIVTGKVVLHCLVDLLTARESIQFSDSTLCGDGTAASKFTYTAGHAFPETTQKPTTCCHPIGDDSSTNRAASGKTEIPGHDGPGAHYGSGKHDRSQR